jgi:hypothetical protein
VDNDCDGLVDTGIEIAQDGVDQDCDGWDVIIEDDFEDGVDFASGASVTAGGDWMTTAGSAAFSRTAFYGGGAYSATFSGETYLCIQLVRTYEQVYLEARLNQPSSGRGDLGLSIRYGSYYVLAGIHSDEGFCLLDESGTDKSGILTGLSGGWLLAQLWMTDSGSTNACVNSSYCGTGDSERLDATSEPTYLCIAGSYSTAMYADDVRILGKL